MRIVTSLGRKHNKKRHDREPASEAGLRNPTARAKSTNVLSLDTGNVPVRPVIGRLAERTSPPHFAEAVICYRHRLS